MAISDESNDIYSNTFYDFYAERLPILVLGGYSTVRSYSVLYVLNVIGKICVLGLYLYFMGAGCYTVLYILKDSKPLMVQTGYPMILMCIFFGFQISRMLTENSLSRSSKIIRAGVFSYGAEDIEEEYLQMKRKRINQLRLLINFLSFGMFFCAMNIGVVVPLMAAVFGGESEEGTSVLNEYLPLQIYMPFDTRTYYGYVTAYVSNAVVMVTMYSAFACQLQIHLSTTLQVTTEIEVLRHSLGNIERRAYVRFAGSRTRNLTFVQTLYENPEYQKCLYLCLRDNILHHQAILRFKEAMSPYVEVATTFVIFFFSFSIASAVVVMIQYSRPQVPSVTDLVGFFPMCWVGQLLTDQSALIHDALFGTPWPSCSEEYKVLLKVFMMNTQKPLLLKTKVVTLNIYLETFADMVSLGYKFINLMR